MPMHQVTDLGHLLLPCGKERLKQPAAVPSYSSWPYCTKNGSRPTRRCSSHLTSQPCLSGRKGIRCSSQTFSEDEIPLRRRRLFSRFPEPLKPASLRQFDSRSISLPRGTSGNRERLPTAYESRSRRQSPARFTVPQFISEISWRQPAFEGNPYPPVDMAARGGEDGSASCSPNLGVRQLKSLSSA